MENEIKVEEYIRTAQGTIAQIEEDEFEIKTNIRGQLLYEKWIEGNRYYEVIVKHSPKLIDLIQCGDYVNGHLIEEIQILQDKKCLFYDLSLPMQVGLHFYMDYDIKEIVTKEMMESISYKVKE